MSDKFTPGPWRVNPRHGHGDEVSGCGLDIDGPPEPLLLGQFSREADARLAAAAPDLLAACSLLVEELCWRVPQGKAHGGGSAQRAYEAGVAAIKRAIGEDQC